MAAIDFANNCATSKVLDHLEINIAKYQFPAVGGGKKLGKNLNLYNNLTVHKTIYQAIQFLQLITQEDDILPTVQEFG